MFRPLALIVVLLIGVGSLGACDTTPERQRAVATMSLGSACQAYAAALRVLAPQRAAGNMQPADIAQVDSLNSVVDPVCESPVPPVDMVDAVTRITSAVATVMLIASQGV